MSSLYDVENIELWIFRKRYRTGGLRCKHVIHTFPLLLQFTLLDEINPLNLHS